MKKRTVLTIAFAVLAAAAIAVGFFMLSRKGDSQKQSTTKKQAYDLIDEAYRTKAQALGVKLYDSGTPGLFYSLSPLKYYAIQGEEIKELKAKKSISTSVRVASAQMNFDIPLVRFGGKDFGIGIWHADAGVYNDAFAVVQTMPDTLNTAGSYLLLIDTSQTDADASRRMFSELIALGEDGSVRDYVFDQRNRTTEQSGKLRTDWACTTQALINHSEGAFILSGKRYNRDMEHQKFDLLRGAGEQLVAEGIRAKGLQIKGEKVYFVQPAQTAWKLLCSTAGVIKETAAFKGDFDKDYFVTADTAVRKEKPVIIDLQSGKESTPQGSFKKLYAVQSLSGKRVLIGKEENKEGKDYKVQKIVVEDKEKNRQSVYYANDVMDENSSLLLCKEGILTLKDGKSVFISYAALESAYASVVQ